MYKKLGTIGTMTVGNTRVRHRVIKWCLTLNNYTNDELGTIGLLCSECDDYMYQMEMGENETPHIQGCFKFKKPKDLSALKVLLERAHWEKCNNWNASVKYCSKDDTRIDGPYKPVSKGILSGKLYVWQMLILKQLSMDPDARTVNWVVDTVGNSGKTWLCKHIIQTHKKALYLSGQAKYMKYAIMESIDAGITPSILLLDIPRSSEGYVSYGGIEEIKNGMFFNVHYKAKMVVYDSPHVWIFANFWPDGSQLSMDRWNIIVL